MNRQQFIEFIGAPEKISRENSALLDGLVKEFPYFQTAQLLYVKSLHNQNSIHYINQLKIAAAYSGDRRILYQLITQQNNIAGKSENTIQSTLFSAQEKKEPENKSIAEIASAEKKENAIESSIPDVIEKEEKKDIQQKTVSSFEQEIIKEVGNSTFELEFINSKVVEEKKSIDIKEKDSSEIKEKALNKQEKHSFGDWLKLAYPKTDQESADALNKKSVSELIADFISVDPKISRPKNEFFSPVTMARQSVIEDANFVTETLAKIYVQQGNLSKAIKAYEVLSLKYPEKKLTFAAQIGQLKKLIH